MTRVWPGLIVLALVAGLGFLLYLGLRHQKDGPVIVGKIDTVPDTVLVASRPKIVTRWRERIVIKTVPAQVTLSEGVPDTAWAMRYARAAIRSDSLRRASSAQSDSARLARIHSDSAARQPILPPASGTYDGSTLRLYLTRSDGSLMRATAKLKPRFAFFAGTDGGSDTLPRFQSDRWFVRLGRQSVKCAPPVGVMAGLGALVHTEDRLLGAAVTGGATLVGCLTS